MVSEGVNQLEQTWQFDTSWHKRISIPAVYMQQATAQWDARAKPTPWCGYVPATWAPPLWSSRLTFREHPFDAIAYYQQHGVKELECCLLPPGERVIVALWQNPESACQRFGSVLPVSGVCYDELGDTIEHTERYGSTLVTHCCRVMDDLRVWSALSSGWLCWEAILTSEQETGEPVFFPLQLLAADGQVLAAKERPFHRDWFQRWSEKDALFAELSMRQIRSFELEDCERAVALWKSARRQGATALWIQPTSGLAYGEQGLLLPGIVCQTPAAVPPKTSHDTSHSVEAGDAHEQATARAQRLALQEVALGLEGLTRLASGASLSTLQPFWVGMRALALQSRGSVLDSALFIDES